jgi:hypothetical protein
MYRKVLMLGLAMLLALVAAGAAMAITKTCRGIPCEGTDNNDVLYERIGRDQDRIRGLDGRDVIDANTFDPDRDVLLGGAGRDRLLTNDTDRFDVANGGRARDICYVSRGDTTRSCEVLRRATFRAGSTDLSKDLSKAAFGQ